ncbi:TetR/AcrR family transcriptional regulator [Bacteroidia bacterium]|nr:TetR/AcrR family transcriptional regulator [Bacteroidia bacterium]
MAKPKLDRKTLLKNSLSVFKSRGYHGTSVNDLAAANGLLKGSIYHYFDSKKSLMLEVLIALKEHYVAKVFAKSYDEQLPPYERLRELAVRAEEIFTFEETGDFFVNIGLETMNTNPEFLAVIKEFFRDWIGSLQDLYLHVLGREEALMQAERVVAELEGSVIMMKLLGDVGYLKRTSTRVLNEYKELEKLKLKP